MFDTLHSTDIEAIFDLEMSTPPICESKHDHNSVTENCVAGRVASFLMSYRCGGAPDAYVCQNTVDGINSDDFKCLFCVRDHEICWVIVPLF